MATLTLFIGWMLAIMVGLFALMVLYRIHKDKDALKYLLCESTSGDPRASMARFQFLIFTFVISLCLLLVTVSEPIGFPDLPTNVLLLLGISGGSYAVGKGIQASSDSSKSNGKNDAANKA